MIQSVEAMPYGMDLEMHLLIPLGQIDLSFQVEELPVVVNDTIS
jgi:hypothetical protein